MKGREVYDLFLGSVCGCGGECIDPEFCDAPEENPPRWHCGITSDGAYTAVGSAHHTKQLARKALATWAADNDVELELEATSGPAAKGLVE